MPNVLVGPAPLVFIRFRGPDRHKVLNGLFTNDIKSLAPQNGLHACLLSPQSKLISHLFIYNRGEDLLGLCPTEALPPLKTALEKYLAVSDTLLEELPTWACLAAFFGPDTPEPKGLEAAFPAGDRLLGKPFRALPVEQDQLDPVLEILYDAGAKPFTPDDLETWRVEGAVPRFGVDVDDSVYPVEANLQSAVHPTKGCYLGQEVIARLMNKGKPRRRLVRLKLAKPVLPGALVVWKGKEIGHVTSVARSARFKSTLGLALLPEAAAHSGQVLALRTPNGEVNAEVLPDD